MKKGDIRAPSVDETPPVISPPVAEDLVSLPTQPPEMKPHKEKTTPNPPAAKPNTVTEKPSAKTVCNETDLHSDTKENKALPKSADPTNYDAKLSAPEVAQKYFVPRPKSRIATKNISFSKSSNKNKKPKYGRGSSPRAGMSPQTGEGTDVVEGDRRQLPSRKSRPQQLIDSDRPETDVYEEDLSLNDSRKCLANNYVTMRLLHFIG